MNEIRISGFGGQGVIRCGYIIGKTAALFDGKHATLTQSFGPEARGSACSAQIIVDDVPVRYPYLTTPDTVVAMSQEAYDKYGSDITPDGTLMIDDDLVTPVTAPATKHVYAIPATRIAEELGNRIAANIVMLGFFTAVTDIISVEAARGALPSSVPSRFLELNEKAFEQGYAFGCELVGTEPAPRSTDRKPAGEYRPTSISKAKAGRRATTLARVNRMTGEAMESEEAKKAWKSVEKKAAKLKAAEKKALADKMSGAKKATGTKRPKSGAMKAATGKKKAKASAGRARKSTAKKTVASAGRARKSTAKKTTPRKKAGAPARKSQKSTKKKSPGKK